jgi:hypothetical protein
MRTNFTHTHAGAMGHVSIQDIKDADAVDVSALVAQKAVMAGVSGLRVRIRENATEACFISAWVSMVLINPRIPFRETPSAPSAQKMQQIPPSIRDLTLALGESGSSSGLQ